MSRRPSNLTPDGAEIAENEPVPPPVPRRQASKREMEKPVIANRKPSDYAPPAPPRRTASMNEGPPLKPRPELRKDSESSNDDGAPALPLNTRPKRTATTTGSESGKQRSDSEHRRAGAGGGAAGPPLPSERPQLPPDRPTPPVARPAGGRPASPLGKYASYYEPDPPARDDYSSNEPIYTSEQMMLKDALSSCTQALSLSENKSSAPVIEEDYTDFIVNKKPTAPPASQSRQGRPPQPEAAPVQAPNRPQPPTRTVFNDEAPLKPARPSPAALSQGIQLEAAQSNAPTVETKLTDAVSQIPEGIHLDARSCKGYMFKLGGKRKNWKWRWFELDLTKKHLTYFEDNTEKVCKGFIPLYEITDARTSDNPKSQFDGFFMLQLTTSKRVYQMRATDDNVIRAWVAIVNKAISH